MLIEFHGYLVSDEGVVLSKQTKRTNFERRPMTVLVDDKGYHKVQLIVDGKQKQMRVHRVVASLFLGLDLYDESTEVHHKDENKSNNAKDNLRIVDKALHSHLHSLCEGDSATHKVCRNCGTVKERSEFYALSDAPKYDAQSSWCRYCANHRPPEYLAKRRERNRK